MEQDVIINGVRYVPEQKHADGVRFYFMHDNHTFTRLKGDTLDEVLAHADAVEAGEHGSYGMLCPAKILHGKKDVRSVGPTVHARGSRDPKDHWNAGKVEWRKALEADADVMRLMPSNVELSRR